MERGEPGSAEDFFEEVEVPAGAHRLALRRVRELTADMKQVSFLWLAHDHYTTSMGSGGKFLVDEITWTTSAGCSLHNFLNGYKQGLDEYSHDKHFMAAMF